MKKAAAYILIMASVFFLNCQEASAASKLTVNTVYSAATKVTGKTRAYNKVKIKAGRKTVSGKANKKGVYSVRIARQKAGTKVTVRSYRGKKLYAKKTVTVRDDKWTKALKKYQKNKGTRDIIFVKYEKGSSAKVEYYKKNTKNQWKKSVSCSGYVGRKGINKKKEGDKKTPAGTFNIIQPFGIKKDPGAKTDYLKAEKYHYWCADKYYNRLVDIRKKPHKCKGEHLVDYKGTYNYGLFLDYNKKNVKGKGSAIFMHCSGKYKYTGGCIAVPEKYMKKIIQNLEPGAKIVIAEK